MNCYRCQAPLQEGEGFWNEGGPGYGKCGACVRAILAEQPATCKPDLQVQPLSFREQAVLACMQGVLAGAKRDQNGLPDVNRGSAAYDAVRYADALVDAVAEFDAERVARGGIPQSELDKIKENGK